MASSERDIDETEPAGLVAAGTAAHLGGEHRRAVALLQEAFHSYSDRSDRGEALYVAFLLAMVFGTTGRPAMFSGWLARAQRLLAETYSSTGTTGSDDGDETAPDYFSVGRGYVAVLELHQALGSGCFDAVGALSAELIEVGHRHRVPDLFTLGMVARGRYSIHSGDVPQGLALLDEAMATILAGECRPLATGLAWCAAIEGCQEIGATDRLCEWTSTLADWCTRNPGVSVFDGECSLHTGQVLALQGGWTEAIAEFAASRARFEFRSLTLAAGTAERERGDLLRLRGEERAAEEAYQSAAERGCDPQPGLALLWLARGKQAAAIAAIHRCLAEAGPPAHRMVLLPSAVEVHLAVGHIVEAEPLLAELDDLAAATESATAFAAAAHSHACLELSRQDADGALPYARKAVQGWSSIGCPFEVARSRVALARALSVIGDQQSCRRELDAALGAFTALEAAPSAAEVAGLVELLQADKGSAGTPAGLSPREVEVLRLVATGRSNRQIASALGISEKTVARHISNIFAKVDVTSRTGAAAFAYEHRLV